VAALSCAAVLQVCGLAQTAHAQVTWQANVPDFFQHQRWGSDGTIPGGGAGAGDPEWEADYTPAAAAGPGGVPPARPENGGFGGWCFDTAVSNQLYFFRQRGYGTFGGVANPQTVAATHDQIKVFNTDYGNTFADNLPKSTAKRINDILDARGSGPALGINGLLSQNFVQQGTSIFYRNARGIDSKFGKGTLYDNVQTVARNGDISNIRLTYEAVPAAGSSQAGLWWAGPNPGRGNFHVVTVAGIDRAGNGTLSFSDPDSNKGNNNNNAGWDADIADWKAAPAGVPVKARRYNGGDAYKPAGAAPTNPERDAMYYPGVLAPTHTSFSITAGANDRYDDVEIKYQETLEVIKGAPKPAPIGGPPPGEGKRWQVSPGITAANIINQIWLYPANAAQKITNIISSGFAGLGSSSAWKWTILPGIGDADPDGPGPIVPGYDEYGNPRPDGGLQLEADPLSPFWASRPLGLVGNEYLEFQYETASTAALSQWDFLYNDMLDPTLLSLGVQTYGDNSGYDLPHVQIPAPGVMGMVGAGALLIGRRRRR
jgi:hypothetical protein